MGLLRLVVISLTTLSIPLLVAIIIFNQSERNRGKESTVPEFRRRPRFPDVVIAGVKKGGTGTLRDFLGTHSKISIIKEEKHFFDRMDSQNLSVKWYLEQMPIATEDQLIVEKTPKYFVTPGAAEMIQQMGASIILILRNPVTRVLSDCEQWRVATKDNTSFKQLLLDTRGEVQPNSELIVPSLYSNFMPEWLYHFKLGEKLLILDGENFAKRPWEELEKVQDFLGIPQELTVDSFAYSEEKGFFCLHSETAVRCQPASKGRVHQEIDHALANKLATFFEPYNEELFNMLGRKFDWNT